MLSQIDIPSESYFSTFHDDSFGALCGQPVHRFQPRQDRKAYMPPTKAPTSAPTSAPTKAPTSVQTRIFKAFLGLVKNWPFPLRCPTVVISFCGQSCPPVSCRGNMGWRHVQLPFRCSPLASGVLVAEVGFLSFRCSGAVRTPAVRMEAAIDQPACVPPAKWTV